jgi:NAD(P)H-dependent FMN reductase
MGRRLLLVSGSLRAASTTAAVVRTAAELVPDGVVARPYERLGALPHFNPDDDVDPLPPEVAVLRDEIHRATAVLFCTPEYAGALPGTFKNLLDWTIGDDQPDSIFDKRVAWINASPRGAAGAHEELRVVLGYAHAAIVESACAALAVTAAMVDEAGTVRDTAARRVIAGAVRALLDDPVPATPGAGVSERAAPHS